jgi:hypothetical protein
LNGFVLDNMFLPTLLVVITVPVAAGSTCQNVNASEAPGAVPGQLSQPSKSNAGLPFMSNPNPGCAGEQYKGKACSFVDTAAECEAGCVRTAGCTAWNVFWSCNTGPKPPGGRTKHSCELLNITAQSNDGDGALTRFAPFLARGGFFFFCSGTLLCPPTATPSAASLWRFGSVAGMRHGMG